MCNLASSVFLRYANRLSTPNYVHKPPCRFSLSSGLPSLSRGMYCDMICRTSWCIWYLMRYLYTAKPPAAMAPEAARTTSKTDHQAIPEADQPAVSNVVQAPKVHNMQSEEQSCSESSCTLRSCVGAASIVPMLLPQVRGNA